MQSDSVSWKLQITYHQLIARLTGLVVGGMLQSIIHLPYIHSVLIDKAISDPFDLLIPPSEASEQDPPLTKWARKMKHAFGKDQSLDVALDQNPIMVMSKEEHDLLPNPISTLASLLNEGRVLPIDSQQYSARIRLVFKTKLLARLFVSQVAQFEHEKCLPQLMEHVAPFQSQIESPVTPSNNKSLASSYQDISFISRLHKPILGVNVVEPAHSYTLVPQYAIVSCLNLSLIEPAPRFVTFKLSGLNSTREGFPFVPLFASSDPFTQAQDNKSIEETIRWHYLLEEKDTVIEFLINQKNQPHSTDPATYSAPHMAPQLAVVPPTTLQPVLHEATRAEHPQTKPHASTTSASLSPSHRGDPSINQSTSQPVVPPRNHGGHQSAGSPINQPKGNQLQLVSRIDDTDQGEKLVSLLAQVLRRGFVSLGASTNEWLPNNLSIPSINFAADSRNLCHG